MLEPMMTSMAKRLLSLNLLAALLALAVPASARPAPHPAPAPRAAAASGPGCGVAAHCTTLSWTETTVPPAGYTLTFNVYRGTTAGGESSTPINSAPLTSTNYVDPVTLTGVAQTFYYTVQAVETGAIAQQATSSEVSATFPGILSAPAAAVSTQ
jgi:hypothetical protein